MPKIETKTPKERSLANRISIYARRDGTLILEPSDLFEGLGNLLERDEHGDPVGFPLARSPQIDGHNVYGGRDPGKVVRQNSERLAVDVPSYTLDHPLLTEGPEPPPPVEGRYAKIPRPLPPVLLAVPAQIKGFPGSTPLSPYWIAFTYADELHQHTTPGQASPFHLAEGQGARVPIPDTLPPGARYLGIWICEPGSGTTTRPGTLRLQCEVTIDSLSGPYVELTEFKHGRTPPSQNETKVPRPPAPGFSISSVRRATKIATYLAAITWTKGGKETEVSPNSVQIVMVGSTYYRDDQGEIDAARGAVVVSRPLTVPPGVDGWYPYVLQDNQWNRIWSKSDERGRVKPFPLSIRSVTTQGWQGNEEYAANDDNLLISADPPTENETGVDPPDFRPEMPQSFGETLPAPGTYHFKVCDTHKNQETLPSDVASITITAGQKIKVVFQSRVNKIIDGSFIETTHEGKPVHGTYDETGGEVYVEDGDLVLETDGVVAGDTPLYYDTNEFEVYEDEPWSTTVFVETEQPEGGEMTGAIEVVFVETDEAGAEQEFSMGVLDGVGEAEFELVMEPPGALSLEEAGQVSAKSAAGRLNHQIGVTRAKVRAKLIDNGASHKEVKARLRQVTSHLREAGLREQGNEGGGRRETEETAERPPRRDSEREDGDGRNRKRNRGGRTHDERGDGEKSERGGRRKQRDPDKKNGRGRRKKKKRPHKRPPGSPPVVLPPDPPPPPPPPAYRPTIPEFPDWNLNPPPRPPVPPDRGVLEGIPETLYPHPEPFRPKASSLLLEQLNFESGMPDGWTVQAANGGSATVGSAGAIGGTGGLILGDSTTAAGHAYITKTFPSDTPWPRHCMGLSTRNQMPLMPAAGSVKLHTFSRLADDEDFLWLEIGAERETADLVIETAPTKSGSALIYADGVSYTIPLNSTKEVQTLTIPSDPTSYGTMTIDLAGREHTVEVGGTKEIVTLALGNPRYNGNLLVDLAGTLYAIPVSPTESANQTAERIRQMSFPGWEVSGTANGIAWISTVPGNRPPSSYERGSSATPGTMEVLQEGVSETALEFAARLRAEQYNDFDVSGSGTTVVFTAQLGGMKLPSALVFSSGLTFAAGAPTITRTVTGIADTPDQVAQKIRTRVGGYPGWNVSGTNNVATFEGTTPGWKQNVVFHDNGTGVFSKSVTRVDGKDGDLWAYLLEDDGELSKRRIMGGIDPATIFDLDMVVVGAGMTTASVYIFASFNGAEKELAAYWEDVDLEGYATGKAKVGVTGETQAATTWELHVDNVRVTDRGDTYFREHDWLGRLLPQLHLAPDPEQPVSDELLFKESRWAVFELTRYTFGVYLYNRDVQQVSSPIVAIGYFEDGTSRELGRITCTQTTGWREATIPLDIPADCFEVGFRSEDMGPGEFVLQELATSKGTTVVRDGRYATYGLYEPTLDIGTPFQPPNVRLGRRLLNFDSAAIAPEGTTLTEQFRSSVFTPEEAEPGAGWSEWYTHSEDVPFGQYIQYRVEMTSNGYATPEVEAGYPSAEYRIYPGYREGATLLTHDRKELPGGAVFGALEEWYTPPGVIPRELPDGRITYQKRYENRPGKLPESLLQIFTPEAYAYVMEHWDEGFVIESGFEGKIAHIRLSGEPTLKRQQGTDFYHDGRRYALYLGDLPVAEVWKEEVFDDPSLHFRDEVDPAFVEPPPEAP